MSRRSHRSLRLGALALLAAMALWPRPSATVTTHSVGARAETTAAKLVSPPRTAKLAVGEPGQGNGADESQLSN